MACKFTLNTDGIKSGLEQRCADHLAIHVSFFVLSCHPLCIDEFSRTLQGQPLLQLPNSSNDYFILLP